MKRLLPLILLLTALATAHAAEYLIQLQPGERITLGDLTIEAVQPPPATQPADPADPPEAINPPALAVTATDAGVRITLADGPVAVPVEVWVRSKAKQAKVGVIPAGSASIDYAPETSADVPLRPNWEVWFWAVTGGRAGVETRHQVKLSSDPDPPAPPVEQPQAMWPAPPASAIRATNPAHARQLIDQNRKDGKPILIEGLDWRKADGPLKLEKNANVWIVGNTFSGFDSFNDWASPIYAPGSSTSIVIAGNLFRDNPNANAIFAYNLDRSHIVGNRFERTRQPIHLIFSPGDRRDTRITHNVCHDVGKIGIEIQGGGQYQPGDGAPAEYTSPDTIDGLVVAFNDMRATDPGEIVYSLAMSGTRRAQVHDNLSVLPGNHGEPGRGWHFELMGRELEVANNECRGGNNGFVVYGPSRSVRVRSSNVTVGVARPVTTYISRQKDGSPHPWLGKISAGHVLEAVQAR